MFETDKVFYKFDDKPNWGLSTIIAMQYVVKFAILLSLILLLARTAHISTMDITTRHFLWPHNSFQIVMRLFSV
ncbi:MAG: hypothetical protein GY782_09605 [Gammaproteobacteria bacterium]|nr:hypothetical protein [Gammaproteobacteria bacterium]